MLISHKKKFIFIHIQKTAGSSMVSLLKDHIPDFTRYMGTHDHALWAKDKMDFSWNDYYKVAFVRNPWDRLVSWYMMIVQNADALRAQDELNDLWRYVLEHSTSFEEFLYHCTETLDDNDGKKSFLFNQLDYVCDENGRVIVDFIGRFEHLERDSQRVFEHLNLQGLTMPHYNTSKRDHYQSYYNEDTRLLVAERYARDIEFFQYKFENSLIISKG